MTYVSFPGFRIPPFHMDPVVFSLGPLSVRWYGLIITCGMIFAVLLAIKHAKIEKVKTDDIVDLALYLIIFGVIGARLYYVIMKLDQYIVSEGSFLHNLGRTLYNIVAVWEGGLAIYGGIIGGAITIFVFARKKKIRFPVLFDIVSPSVMLGQIIGRWGNFVNVEAHGGETTLPWRMGILTSLDGGNSFIAESYVHPTFLYESLWNLIGLVFLLIFYKRKKYHGQILLMYITWYGFGRMLIEGLRTDSLYVGEMRISQFIGFASFITGTIVLIYEAFKHKKRLSASSDYEPVYSKSEKITASDKSTASTNDTQSHSEECQKDGNQN